MGFGVRLWGVGRGSGVFDDDRYCEGWGGVVGLVEVDLIIV